MSEQGKGCTSEQLEKFEEWSRQRSKKIEISDVAGPIRVGPPRIEDVPRFPTVLWPPAKENLQKNLEKYVKLARDLGTVDAKVIPTKDIPLDLRVLYVGCINPICRWLNTNANCPMVRTFPFEYMKEYLASFDYALVYKVIPPLSEPH